MLDADRLDAAAMQRIAAEMLVPGTAFVSASTQPGADWRLRMFTPKREVGYSGHTALCGTHALLESGRLPGDRVIYDTPAGRAARWTIERGAGRALMWLEPPLPACRTFEGDLGEILDALGLPRAAVGRLGAPRGDARPGSAPPRAPTSPRCGRSSPTCAVWPRCARRSTRAGSACVSRETVDPGSRSHCRFFAPHYGIPEDIVTGSVHSSLGVWLLEAGALRRRRRARGLHRRAGRRARPPRAACRWSSPRRPGTPARVRVGGRAVTVLTGRLRSDA